MANPVYPETFRCAQWTPYQVAVDMGVLRTPMESGLARQRRLYRTMPTQFRLEFVMTVPELGAWQRWVNQFGYDYFTMGRLESYYAGLVGEISSPHSIRFISNLEYDNPVYGWVRVKVQAELDPLQPLPGPPVPTNAWIIAGTPPVPSNAITIISDFTLVDFVAAGTPAYPAAVL